MDGPDNGQALSSRGVISLVDIVEQACSETNGFGRVVWMLLEQEAADLYIARVCIERDMSTGIWTS